jgi:hypothetical protein
VRILGPHEDYELVRSGRPGRGVHWDRRSAAELLRRLATSPGQCHLLQRLGGGASLSELAARLAAGTIELRPRRRRNDRRTDVDHCGTITNLADLAAR